MRLVSQSTKPEAIETSGDTMRVGLVGVGKMGTPIGLHMLAAGYPVAVYDIRPGQLRAPVNAGASAAGSAREVAEQSDVVFTSLPGPEEILAVSRGEQGLLAGLAPGKAWFDLSTSSPTLARELHSEYAARGIQMLDAPVSGGPYGAESGKLSIWVGGDRATYDHHLPLLKTIGDEVSHIGEAGSASIAKLVHNCAGFVMYASLAEVFSMGIKAGLQADVLWETVRKGLNGRRPLFDCLARNFMPSQYDDADFTLAHAEKDCRLALELAAEQAVPMQLAQHAHRELTAAIERGWSTRDARASMLLQLERAGIEPLALTAERIAEILAD
jgi:3-hydroxyisobutyrate dehydrogenase